LAKRAKRREVTSGGDAAAEERMAELATADVSPPLHAMSIERAEMVERLLERLPESQADALRLRFFGDLKFQEIADVTECSLSTAKVRVRDGLLRLAEWLGEEGEDGGDAREGGGESKDKRLVSHDSQTNFHR
ncbi:MAG TPA: RNA polymerase sigma factor, partial [Pirellulaceae bacterium]|nr:RNA polymerase sigma factor [Pirellulaceae bacterium]